MDGGKREPAGRAARAGLWLGLGAALALQLVPVPEGLTREAWIVVSLAALMAVWWATEAIPIPVTALLPLVILPLSGALPMAETASHYAEPTVFLFLGGFIIAMAIERWRLHARIALNIAVRFGAHPGALMLGFMAAAAALSMWISNTATTIMLAPIAIRVAMDAEDDGAAGPGYAPALLLGLAYAASIGGMGTPVGTPTNLLVMGWLADNGAPISFAQWVLVGTPLTWAMIPLAWLALSRRVKTGPDASAAADTVRAHLDALGPMTAPERRVLIAFGCVAAAWMLRPLLNQIPGLSLLSDTGVAIIGAVAMFLIPAGDRSGARLLDWETAVRLPWGVILLFGGGLALAYSIEATGLAAWLGGVMGVAGGWPLILLVGALVTLVLFATELMSNVATVSALLPVFGALSIASGADPALIAVPVGMAASCAFMLPVATPPNAVVFASGRVTVAQMIRAGFALDIIAIPVITLMMLVLAPLVLG